MRCLACLAMHSGIKTSEMLVIASLCDVSHGFKNSPPSAFLCIWSQINVDVRHSPQQIKTLPFSWLELPRNHHVELPTWKNDMTPFKEAWPSPKPMLVQTTRSAPVSDLTRRELGVFLTSSGGSSQVSRVHALKCRRPETRPMSSGL